MFVSWAARIREHTEEHIFNAPYPVVSVAPHLTLTLAAPSCSACVMAAEKMRVASGWVLQVEVSICEARGLGAT